LQGVTVEEVQEILATSSLTENADLTFIDDDYQQVVKWHWSEDMAERLTSGDLFLLAPYESNRIIIRNHLVWSEHLTFAISLEELLGAFGAPMAVSPNRFTRFGSEIFALIYQNPPGHFEAWTACDAPELSADTAVRAYTHMNMTKSNFKDDYAGPILPWDGYTDELPDCTVFQP
jgi:hypothetical protein